jgi:hypothetical protein
MDDQNEAPAELPVQDVAPTPDEARAIFSECPDVWAVVTTEGRMTRDGVIDRSTAA